VASSPLSYAARGFLLRGRVLIYTVSTNTGAISGDNGQRYQFEGKDWQGQVAPNPNAYVDFAVEGNHAVEIIPVPGGGGIAVPGSKNRVTAALLAIFLGGVGAHKFYLGYGSAGALMLVGTIVGIITAIFLIGFIFLAIVGAIAFIEFIIYLTKSDEDFDRIYVQGRKSWF
jgi:TM2 domain-containing membrane protein YozV